MRLFSLCLFLVYNIFVILVVIFFTTCFYSFTSQPAITGCTNDIFLTDVEEKCHSDTLKQIVEFPFKILGVLRAFIPELSFMKEIYYFLWSQSFSIDWCLNSTDFFQFHPVLLKFNLQMKQRNLFLFTSTLKMRNVVSIEPWAISFLWAGARAPLRSLGGKAVSVSVLAVLSQASLRFEIANRHFLRHRSVNSSLVSPNKMIMVKHFQLLTQFLGMYKSRSIAT